MYQLHIANKNYSSWSLRPWLLLRQLGVGFDETLHVFGDTENWQHYRKTHPAGLVPCLLAGELVVWDSLAIVEYLAEQHTGVWPTEPIARAWARCASAEMHSGFNALRTYCSMSCGVRITLHRVPEALARDLARLEALWLQGLRTFGGPFLAGATFSAVDAFYAPVAFRLQTYGIQLTGEARAYGERLLALPAMQDWYRAALREPYRDVPHDEKILEYGTPHTDLRESATQGPTDPVS